MYTEEDVKAMLAAAGKLPGNEKKIEVPSGEPDGMSVPTTGPADTFRAGVISCSVWVNQTRNGSMMSVTFQRGYQVEGEWRNSKSFGLDDLLKVAELCSAVYRKYRINNR